MGPAFDKLTIAIPVFNEAEHILAALRSTVGQAARVVIYDNHSDDGTSAICERFASEHPQVTHIRHPANIGAFANFRQALFDCTTEFFQWVGAHDLLGENSSTLLLPLIDGKSDVALAVGKILYMDEDGQPMQVKKPMIYDSGLLSDDVFHRLLKRLTVTRDCYIIHGILRTEIARIAWFEPACIGCDEGFLFRVVAAGKIAHDPLAVYLARTHTRSRVGQDHNERRTRDLVAADAAPIARDQTTMTRVMFQTITNLLNSPQAIQGAFPVISAIHRTHHETKRQRKQRRARRIALGGLIAAWVAALAGWILTR
jgi:hypothetical protein